MSIAIGRSCASFLLQRNVSFSLWSGLSSTSFSPVLLSRASTTSVVQRSFHMSSSFADQPKDLPRLPVPTLADTSRKFLKTVAPLLNNDEFNQTKQIVGQFQHESQPLQELLLKRAQTEENWLSQWWLDKVYLEWRSNLPIFYNPALLFPRQAYRDFDGQIQFAANFIHGALLYRTLIDNDQLTPDRFGKDFLCMDQYKKLFVTCRIPAKRIDRLHLYKKMGHNHIAVFHRNNLYRLPVYDENGEKFSAQTIYNHLRKLEQWKESSDDQATLIGHLTADERQLWAPIYSQLAAVPENQRFFQTINDSLLVLCLDEKYSTASGKATSNGEQQTVVGLNVLHGGGTRYNTANRWFDKTLQVVVGPDGYAGLNYEHSMAEGGMVTALVDYILDYCKSAQALTPSATNESSLLSRCRIQIPKEIEGSIVESRQRVDKFVDNCALLICKYSDYGKRFAKQNKLSIDAIIQIALQVAYYRHQQDR